MTVIYRTSGAWGAGKGANLTPAEVDGNFYDHAGRIANLEGNPPSAINVSHLVQNGNLVTIYKSDGSTLGTITLPRATPPVVQNKTVTTWTPTLDDRNTYTRFANACVISLPLNASVAFAAGDELHICQRSAGAVQIEQWSGGPNIYYPIGFLPATDRRGAVMTAKYLGSDEWDVFGMLAEEAT